MFSSSLNLLHEPEPESVRPGLVTLKDVAREAKVHFTTVSLALRGSPKIPEETRERIAGIARRLGYRRDPIQLALTARRPSTQVPRHRPRVAFLTNRPDEAAFNNTAHMPAFLAGAAQQAEAMGYACDLVLCGDERVSAAEIEDRLVTSGTEGIILAAFVPFFRSIELDWARYAIVKIDSCFMAPATTRVTNDQAHVIQLAYETMHARGYRRIGMAVGAFDDETTDGLFAASYLLAQDRLGFEYIPPLHFAYSSGGHAASVARLATWVREQRLDAVVSNWENILQLLELGGIGVPEEIACACLSLSAPNPKLAGVVQNHYTVGQKAAETVALLLKAGRRGPFPDASATYVEGTWSDGLSAPLRPMR